MLSNRQPCTTDVAVLNKLLVHGCNEKFSITQYYSAGLLWDGTSRSILWNKNKKEEANTYMNVVLNKWISLELDGYFRNSS